MHRIPLLGLSIGILLSSAACDITTRGPTRTDLEARDRFNPQFGGKVAIAVLPRNDLPRQGLFDRTQAPGDSNGQPTAVPDASTAPNAAGWTGTSEAPEPHAEEPVRRRVRPTLAFELDYRTSQNGKDHDSIGPDVYIDYDDRRIDGPANIAHDFDLHVATADVRGGVRFFDKLSLEGLAGLSTTTLHFVVRSPSVRSGDTSTALGVNIGSRITYAPHPVFDLYAQGQLHLLGGLQSDHGTVHLRSAEVGTNVHLTRNLSIFGGWRAWVYGEQISNSSDISDIKGSGPTAGLALRF